MIRYNIHNLIDVFVESSVSDFIKNDINFQIMHFKTHNNDNFCKKQIVIKPYSRLVADRSLNFQTFHLTNGVYGKLLDDKNNEVAFEKNDNGFVIYAAIPNFLINLFIQALLIQDGYSMVHAAAFENNNGSVTLLPGAGGIGKTALLGNMVKDHHYRLLGDDIILLGENGTCLSFPRSFVLKEYHREVYPDVFQRLKIKKGANYDIKRFIVDNAPFTSVIKNVLRSKKLYSKVTQAINLTPYLAAVPVEEIFGAQSVCSQGNLENIFFLERYDGKNVAINPIVDSELSRRMFAIIWHEWVASMQQLFSISAMGLLDLSKLFSCTAKIIESAITGCKSQIISIPNKTNPKDLMGSFLELTSLIKK